MMRQGLPQADIGSRTSGRADKTGGQSLDMAATCAICQHRPPLPPHQLEDTASRPQAGSQ